MNCDLKTPVEETRFSEDPKSQTDRRMGKYPEKGKRGRTKMTMILISLSEKIEKKEEEEILGKRERRRVVKNAAVAFSKSLRHSVTTYTRTIQRKNELKRKMRCVQMSFPFVYSLQKRLGR